MCSKYPKLVTSSFLVAFNQNLPKYLAHPVFSATSRPAPGTNQLPLVRTELNEIGILGSSAGS
jgi:hypothetical protein